MRSVDHGDGLRTWQFDGLGDGVLAAVTARGGGVSDGPYASLNLAFHVGDEPDRVRTNRELLCEALGVGPLTVADQQHGRRVAVVDRSLAGAGHASLDDSVARLGATDALVTDLPGVALAVVVADCAPVVLHDPVRRAVGVAHAGRRGVVLDVVGATVAAMASHFGSDPAELRAAIGPCVAASRYEIAGDALDETRAALGNDLLVLTRPGHARFDLLAAVRRRLAEAGVPAAHVEAAGVDTGNEFFSDRAERPCGRFALVAALA